MQSARVWQTQEVKGGVAPPEELPSINYDSVRTSMRKMGSAPRKDEQESTRLVSEIS